MQRRFVRIPEGVWKVTKVTDLPRGGGRLGQVRTLFVHQSSLELGYNVFQGLSDHDSCLAAKAKLPEFFTKIRMREK